METFVSEDKNQWYRVWSDGWIEQSGYNFTTSSIKNAYVVQTLLKPFTNTNYTVLLSHASKSQTYHAGTSLYLFSDNYTLTSFAYTARGGDGSNYMCSSVWYACGY